MRRLIIIGCLLALLWPVSSWAAVKYDFGIKQSDIRLSGGQVLVDKTMNVIARIHNYGTEDAKGYATFLMGGNVIGTSQEISILTGTYDDAWIEFTVPSGAFNIQVQIIMTGGVNDQVLDNNYEQTAVITPDIDTDRDGIGNTSDPDDDNDDLSDNDEQAKGTDPLVADTDGDGRKDGADLFPLDQQRWQEEAPTVAVITEVPPPTVAPPARSAPPVAGPATTDAAATSEEISVSGTIKTPADQLADNSQWSAVAITGRSMSWGKYAFSTDRPVETANQFLYTWDFGDGGQSVDRLPAHRFRRPGTYQVQVAVEDAERNVWRGRTTMTVPWYQWLNGALGLLLGLVIGGGALVAARLRNRFVPQPPIVIPAIKPATKRRVAKTDSIE
ncbi:MAG: PKD domain-containing protein [Patescibacteria group bacterium]